MIDPFREGEEFLPLHRLASRLSLAANTVRGWRRKNGLTTTKLGLREYITRADWAAFVTQCNSGKPANERRVRTDAQRERDQIAAAALCVSMGV